MEAVLSHRLHDGSERPIAFISRTLSTAKRNYSQIEKETLACIFGVKKFSSYIYRHHFTLVTDHKPLLSLLHQHHSILNNYIESNSEMGTYTLSMYEYSLSFQTISSTHANNADALSRLPLLVNTSDPPTCFTTGTDA